MTDGVVFFSGEAYSKRAGARTLKKTTTGKLLPAIAVATAETVKNCP